MSNCGYYSCYKGKPMCKHDQNGELYTHKLNRHYNQCDACRRSCGGIYPSQLPTEKIEDKLEVIDKDGNVIN